MLCDIRLSGLPFLSAKGLIYKYMKKDNFCAFELINNFSYTSYFLVFSLGLADIYF